MTDPSVVVHERNVVEAGRFNPRPDGADDEIDLGPYFRSIAARWSMVLGAAVLTAVAVIVAMSMLPLMYEATATLIVVPAKLEAGEQQPSATPFRILLENNVLATEVTKKFHLDEPPYRLTAQEFIRSAARVEDVRGLNILLVKVKLRDDGQRAADVANAVAHGMVALAQQIQDQEAALVSGQLKAPLELARRQLNNAEAAFRARRDQAQLEVRKSDLEAALDERQKLTSLTSRIADERARLAQAEQELEKHSRILEVPRVTGISGALLDAARRDAALPEERQRKPPPTDPEPRAPASTSSPDSQQNSAKKPGERPGGQKPDAETRRERPAPRTATPEDPLVGLDLSNAALNPVFEVLEFQVATSRSRLAGLEKQRAAILGLSTSALTKGLYADEVEVERLESERALLQRVYEDIAFQFEQARASVARRSAQLQVINEAVAPERPLTRGRALGGGMGLVVGGLLACIWALATRPGAGAPR